jgi:hypothetical protein
MPNRSSATRSRWIGGSVVGVVGVAGVIALAVLAGSVLAASAAGPPNTQAPSIIGSPITGTVLTGDRGTWTGTGITYAYAWLRCDTAGSNCTPIAGATGTKYTLTTAVLGATIKFAVTASDSSGEATAASSPTAAITTANGIPANSSPPTITGAATVGTTLASTTGSWVGDQPITYSYQWLQCDPSGNSCAALAGEISSSYKLAQKQVGFTVRVKVIGENSRGSGSAISTQTAVVQDAAGGGIINLPNGGKSVDVVDVPAGERLIVHKVQFSPNPVHSRSSPISVTITVKDTRGYYVRNAFVFLRSTPILTETPADAQTATDGRIKYSIKPRSDFPLKTGYSVQFFVKAYRKGDPTLAGVSGTRLVQVATVSG